MDLVPVVLSVAEFELLVVFIVIHLYTLGEDVWIVGGIHGDGGVRHKGVALRIARYTIAEDIELLIGHILFRNLDNIEVFLRVASGRKKHRHESQRRQSFIQ